MTRPGNYRLNADRARIAVEISEAMAMAANGLPNTKIAAIMGFDDHTVAKRLDEGFTTLPFPETERARKASLVRLAQLDERLIPALTSDDLNTRVRAVEAARKIDERRSRMLGLDLPPIPAVTPESGPSEIDAAIIELSRRHAAKYVDQVKA